MFYRSVQEELKKWKDNPERKPLIINGARQVGKSTALKQFGLENFPKVHYFNFEIESNLRNLFETSLSPASILKGLMIEKDIKIDHQHDLIIFDEIQSCPKALHSLKYFQEDNFKTNICAAGSLLGIHLSSESYPVGKVDEINMFPLSFKEFLLALKLNLLAEELDKEITPHIHGKFWEIWKLYLVVGGLPEVVSTYVSYKDNIFEALTNVREKQKLLINEYIRDMAKHSGKINALHLERVFREIPVQLAKNQDDSVKRFRFSGVLPSVSQYARFASVFDWLNGAGLIFKVPIVDRVEVPIIQHIQESKFKAYIFDVGILSALIDIPPKILLDFDFHTYKGYIAENYVLQEMKCSGVDKVYGWQGTNAEIEFLVSSFSGIIPIEVKAGSVKKAKSFASYIKKYSPEKGFIFGATIPRQDGIVFREPIYRAGITLKNK